MIYDIFIILVVCAVPCLTFGVIYPAAAIAYLKLIKHDKRGVWQLYNIL